MIKATFFHCVSQSGASLMQETLVTLYPQHVTEIHDIDLWLVPRRLSIYRGSETSAVVGFPNDSTQSWGEGTFSGRRPKRPSHAVQVRMVSPRGVVGALIYVDSPKVKRTNWDRILNFIVGSDCNNYTWLHQFVPLGREMEVQMLCFRSFFLLICSAIIGHILDRATINHIPFPCRCWRPPRHAEKLFLESRRKRNLCNHKRWISSLRWFRGIASLCFIAIVLLTHECSHWARRLCIAPAVNCPRVLHGLF